MEWQLLASEEIAPWLPSTAVLDPCGVLGRLGDSMPRQAGQGHLDPDSARPSESLCETNGKFNQQCSTQAGAAEARMCSAQQRARDPVVAKVPGSGAVSSWDRLQQGDCLGAPPLARWYDGSSRAGVWHGAGGAIPSQGIG